METPAKKPGTRLENCLDSRKQEVGQFFHFFSKNYGSPRKITLSARRAKNASGGRRNLEPPKPPKWLAGLVPLETCAGEAPMKYEMKDDVNEIL